MDVMAQPETDQRLENCRTNLRLAIALRKMNYSEVALKAGLSRNTVSQFVSGRTSMTYAKLLAVCDVLQLPIGILHRPDAITTNRIRLHRLLERMPDHLAGRAFEAAAEVVGEEAASEDEAS